MVLQLPLQREARNLDSDFHCLARHHLKVYPSLPRDSLFHHGNHQFNLYIRIAFRLLQLPLPVLLQ
jgi:hypothetical protein